MTRPGGVSPRSHSIHWASSFSGSGGGGVSMPGIVPTATYARCVTDVEPDGAPRLLSQDVRTALWGRESFFPVLILALASVAAFPITDHFRWGHLVTGPLIAATIVVAFHRSRVRHRTLRWSTILVVVASLGSMASQTAAHPPESRLSDIVSAFLMAFLLFFSLPAIIRRAFAHAKMSLNTLAAAVTSYLLIGLFFTYVFRLIAAIQAVPFFVQGEVPIGQFQYFSFITLTTVGYGDLVPATDPGRATAILEALTGQVFLVTAVARVVSLMGRERPAQLAAGEDTDGGPGTQAG
jgi:hypothetical protein